MAAGAPGGPAAPLPEEAAVFLDALDRAGGVLARLASLVAGLALLVMMLEITADVAVRATSGRPLPATLEIVSHYPMVAIAFLPLAMVERRGAGIRIDLLDQLAAGATRRPWDATVQLISAAVWTALAWTTFGLALRNMHVGSFVIVVEGRLPVWPAYFVPPVGFALAALSATVRALRLVLGREP